MPEQHPAAYLSENPNEGDDYGLEMDRLGDAVRDFWKAGGSIEALADMIQDGLQDAGTSVTTVRLRIEP